MKRTTSSRRKNWFFSRSMARAFQDWLETRTRSGEKAAKKATRRPLFAEALEPRVLFSATPAPVEEAPTEGNGEEIVQVSEELSSAVDGLESFSFAEGEDTDFTEADLELLVKESVARWEASGLTAEQIAALGEIEYFVDDLGGNTLGYAEGMAIYLDDDGAGREWFVDLSPGLDEEFVEIDGMLRAELGDAGEGVDLLSVIMHEQGHVLGLEDINASSGVTIMNGVFSEGERRLLEDSEADGSIAGSLEGVHYAVAEAAVSTASQFAYAANASSSDLIDDSSAALASFTASVGGTFSEDFTNDGSGNNGTGAYWSGRTSVDLTYLLQGSATGYDITSINTIYGWQDSASRHAAQSYDVEVTTVDNSAFTLLHTVDYDPFANDFAGSSQVTLTDPSGILASGVTGIRFALITDAGGSEVGVIQELDVFGVPTPLSADTTSINVNGTTGDLEISDTNGANTNDDITIVVDGTDFHVTDATNSVNERIAIAGVTGDIVIEGTGGDDTLTIDLSGGAITRNIIFNGGANGATGDTLVVTGGTFGTVTYDATDATDGVLDFGDFTVTFTGLEPVDLTGSVIGDYVINVDPGNAVATATTTTVSQSGGTDTLVSFTGGLESTLFGTLTGTLTINGEDGSDDIIIVDGVGTDFAGNLTINGGTGNDTVNFTNAFSMAGDLSVTSETINLNGGVVNTGAGTQTFDGAVVLGANTSLMGTSVAFTGTVDSDAGQNRSLTISGNAVLGDGAGVDVIGGTDRLSTLSISGTTVMNLGGNGTFDNDILTTSGQTYTGAVTITQNTALNNQSGILAFGSTLDGAFSFKANSGAGAGIVRFGGAVGSLQSLSRFEAGGGGTTEFNGGTLTTTDRQTHYNNVVIGGNTTFDGSLAVFHFDVDGSLPGAQSLNIIGAAEIGKGGAVTFGGTDALSSISVSGATEFNSTAPGPQVITTGSQTYGAVTLTTDTGLEAGDVFLSGVDLGANTLTTTVSGAAGTVSGAISGSGDFIKDGAGTVTLSGVNTYTGVTTISGGILDVDGTHTGGDTVSIASGATLRGSGSITADISGAPGSFIAADGPTFSLGDSSSSTGFSTSGTLTVDVGQTFTINDSGAAVLGSSTVVNGTLIKGGGAQGFSLSAGDVLSGSGTINGAVTTNSGTLSPGNSPGVLATGNLNISGSYIVEVDGGAGAGAVNGHDQTDVTGTVTLNSGSSNLTVDITDLSGGELSAGDELVIINNDVADGITGEFSNVGEAGVVASNFDGTLDLVLTYHGGDGNDVSLIAGNLTTRVYIDGGGNLVIEDINDVTNDNLTLTVSAGNLIITDSDSDVLIDAQGAIDGTTGDLTNSVTVSLASFAGDVILRTVGGDDAMTFDDLDLGGNRGLIVEDIGAGDGNDAVTFSGNLSEFSGTGTVDVNTDTLLIGAAGGINAAGGNVTTVSSGTTTIDGDIDSNGGNTSVTADGIILNGSSEVASDGGTISLDATTGALTQADGGVILSGGGNVTLDADGNITIGSVNMAAGTLTATSTAGAILDGGDSALDVIGQNFIGDAVNGVGTAANAIDTAITRFEGNGGTGGVFLSELDGFGIGNISAAYSGIDTTNADISITAGANVVVVEAIDATGGDISILGLNGSNMAGVELRDDVLTSGTGNITIEGTGGPGGSSRGVWLSSSTVEVSTVDGNVAITGISSGDDGIFIGGSVVKATGTGSVTVAGTSTGPATGDEGVLITGAAGEVSAAGGTVTITGQSSSHVGVDIAAASIANTGVGDITILGTGGNGTDDHGVSLRFTASIESVNGTIDIDGSSTAGDGFHAETSASVESTGTGAIEITGTGGLPFGSAGIEFLTSASATTADGSITLVGTSAGDDGVVLNGATISGTGTGTVQITGTGGNGAGDFGAFVTGSTVSVNNGDLEIDGSSSGDEGVVISGATASVSSSGTGSITITGTGTGMIAGTLTSAGVVVSGGADISAVGAAITLRGTSTEDAGVVLVSAGTTVTNTGGGSITLTGTGGTEGNSAGVLVASGAVVESVNGDIGATGTSSGGEGVVINAASLSATGSGNISIIGTGDTTENVDDGVVILGSATSLVTTNSGDIAIIGRAGDEGVQISAPVESTGGGNISITATSTGPNVGELPGQNTDFIAIGNGTIDANGGDVTVNANTIVLNASVSSIGGDLVIAPRDAGTTIGLGGGVGALNLSDAEIANLTDGFNSITIGDLAAGTGAVDVDSSNFTDDITIVGGSIAVNGLNATSNEVVLTARTGNITDGGGGPFDIVAGALTLNAASGTIGASGTGSIDLVIDSITTLSSGDQYFNDVDTVTVTSTNAGANTVFLTGGEFDLASDNVVADATSITVEDGVTLDADAIDTLAGVTVKSGGTLKGDGALNGPITIEGSGTITPGEGGPETLATGNLTLNSGAIYTVDLDGTAVGTGYDQIVVTGSVDLNGDSGVGATLDLEIPGFALTGTETFTLIDNDGTDAVVGTFAGLAEGTYVSVPTGTSEPDRLFTISYTGGTGNDVVLSATTNIVTTNISIDGSGNLVIDDILGTSDTDDNISITRSGGNFIIEDLSGNVIGTLITGATQTGVSSQVIVPDTLVTGGVIINTLGGDDTITIGDLGTLNGEISVDGGVGTDSIIQTGDAVAGANEAATYTAETIHIDDNANLETTGTGTITLDASRNIVMDVGSSLTSDAGTISLNAEGTPVTISTFGNFTGIKLSGASVTSTSGDVTIQGTGGNLGNLNKGVHIDLDVVTKTTSSIQTGGLILIEGIGRGAGLLNDGVYIANETVIESTGAAAANTVTISGTGAVGTKLNNGVVITNGSSVDTNGGDLTITAAGGASQFSRALQLLNSNLTSNGESDIRITGIGSGSVEFGVGVDIINADIITSGAGIIEIMGTAANGAAAQEGLRLSATSVVETEDGDITLSGIGGAGGGGSRNHGLSLSSTRVEATGAGSITMTGSGADLSRVTSGIRGIVSTIRTGTGNISLTGTGGGTANLNKGIALSSVTVESTGGGDLSFIGTGRGTTGSAPGVEFVRTSATTIGAGTLTITGTGGTGASGNAGVKISGTSNLSTVDGDIEITGTGQGSQNQNHGVTITASQIEASGDGALTIVGEGGRNGVSGSLVLNYGVEANASTLSVGGSGDLTITGTTFGRISLNKGITMTGTTITSSGSGDIALTGQGSGTSGAGALNSGVAASRTIVQALGSGSIAIDGTGGGGRSLNMGVQLSGLSRVTTASGDITISGESLLGTFSNNKGVAIQSSTRVEAGGAGNVLIIGEGSNNGASSILTSFNEGVSVSSNSAVQTADGDITMRGTGGGKASFNRGVDIALSTVASTSGSIVLEGTGSTNALGVGSANDGVYVQGGSITTGGAITMRGFGGIGASMNYGVRITSSANVNAGGRLLLDGTANSLSKGLFNSGVYVFSNSTVNGDNTSEILGTGGGGTLLNHGVVMGLGVTSNVPLANIVGVKGSGQFSKELDGTFF